MKTMFYLPVNTVKQTFVAFVVFVDTTASFVAKIVSSLTVAKRDAILTPVPKQ